MISSTPASAPMTHYRRFASTDRLLHGFLMFSFLGLAFTGMPLLFSYEPWAARLARIFGGFHAAGLIHRSSIPAAFATSGPTSKQNWQMHGPVAA